MLIEGVTCVKKRQERKFRPCQGSRVPGNNCYRCFLSDLTGLAAFPPPGFAFIFKNGGEERIRTSGTRKGTHTFQACALNQTRPPLRVREVRLYVSRISLASEKMPCCSFLIRTCLLLLCVKDHAFLQLLPHPGLNLSGWHGSRRAGDFLALAEQDKARHGLDGKA